MVATENDVRGREAGVANAVRSLDLEWTRRKEEADTRLKWVALLGLYSSAMALSIEFIETWRDWVFRNAVPFDPKTEENLKAIAQELMGISDDIGFALVNAELEQRYGSVAGALVCNDLAQELKRIVEEWKTPTRSSSRTQWDQRISPANMTQLRGILANRVDSDKPPG